MADLHLGRIAENGDIVVYYHVPVPKDLTTAVATAYAGYELTAPGTTDDEKLAAGRGELREVTRTYNVRAENAKDTSGAMEHIRKTWKELVEKEQHRLTKELAMYGKTLARL